MSARTEVRAYWHDPPRLPITMMRLLNLIMPGIPVVCQYPLNSGNFYDFSGLHDSDFMSNAPRGFEVVGDEQISQAFRLL